MNEEFEELYTPPEKKKKKSDPKLCILMLQFTACFLLATAAICIRFFGGAFYEEVRSCYIRMFEDDTSVTEVLSALSPKAENGNVSSVPGTGAPSSLPTEAGGSSENGESGGEASAVSEGSAASDAGAEGGGAGAEGGGESAAEKAPAGAAVQTSASAAVLKNAVFSFDRVNQYAALSSANAFFLPTSGKVSSEYGYRVNPVTVSTRCMQASTSRRRRESRSIPRWPEGWRRSGKTPATAFIFRWSTPGRSAHFTRT